MKPCLEPQQMFRRGWEDNTVLPMTMTFYNVHVYYPVHGNPTHALHMVRLDAYHL